MHCPSYFLNAGTKYLFGRFISAHVSSPRQEGLAQGWGPGEAALGSAARKQNEKGGAWDGDGLAA